MRLITTVFVGIGFVGVASVGLAKEGCIHVATRMHAADPADEQRVGAIVASGKRPKGYRDGKETKHLIPAYPAAAKKQGLEGVVTMRARVGVDGKVSSIEHSGGPEELLKAVLMKTKDLRYRPFQLDGIEKEMVVDLTVEFRLLELCTPTPPSR